MDEITCSRDWVSACEGPIEWHSLYSNLLRREKSYTMCERHWGLFVDDMQEIEERYPEMAPSDFSPLDAGEVWGEDDY